MSNNPQILEFDFEAHMEIVEPDDQSTDEPSNELATPVFVQKPGPTPNNADDLIIQLNYISDKVAQEIQQQLRLALPPRTRVEVDIQFYKGSLTAIGSVILLFLQPLVVEAGKKVLERGFEEGFSRVIQFAVRRVLSAHTRGVRTRSPMEIDVQPSRETAPLVPSSEPGSDRRETGQDGWPRYLLPLTAVNTALLLILISLLAGGLIFSFP